MIWVALDKWGARLATLVSYAVIARFLSLSELGAGAIVLAIAAIVQLVADGGVATALVRHKALTARTLHTAFWLNTMLGVLAALLLAGLAPAIALLYEAPALVSLVTVLALKMPIVATASVPTAILQRRQRFRAMSLRRIAGNLGGAVVGITAATLGLGVWALVLQSMAASLIATSILWGSAGYRPRRTFDPRIARQLGRFGVNVMLSGALSAAGTQGLILVMGLVLTTQELGLFSIANQITLVALDVLANVVAVVALGRFARSRSLEEREKEFRKSAQLVTFQCAAAFAAIGASGPWLLELIYGPGRADASLFLAVLCFSAYCGSLQSLIRSMLHAQGQSGIELILNGVLLTAQVGLVLLAAPHGTSAVALALIVKGAFTSIVCFYAARKFCGVAVIWVAKVFVLHLLLAAVLSLAFRVTVVSVPITPVNGIILPAVALLSIGIILAGVLNPRKFITVSRAIATRLSGEGRN